MNTSFLSILICGANRNKRDEKAHDLASSMSNKEDILFLDASEQRGIQNTRILLSKLAKKPYNSKVITAVISEAQNLTLEAQNSLLKTLEEPNPTSQIILTTSSELSLLSTVSSRCRKIFLHSEEVQESKLPQIILAASISERLDLCERLNFEAWTEYIRQILKKTIFRQDYSREYLIKLVKYLRFMQRINANKELANPKLTKYLTVVSIPKGL